MRPTKIALALGLTLIVVAIGVVLSRSPLKAAGANSVLDQETTTYTHGNISGCEVSGTLPARTTAIRLSLAANVGPWVRIRVLAGSRLLTQGERAAGWGADKTVTVPVAPLSHTVHGALVCTAVGPAVEFLHIMGTPAKSTSPEGRNLAGIELRMEYLRPGPKSWLSLAPAISRRMGLGRAAGGTWVVFLALALMIAVAILASRLTLREVR